MFLLSNVTSSFCWALPSTRDRDCHIKEILKTCLRLSSFTLEQKKFKQFLLGVFTLWALLTSFISRFGWQQWLLLLLLSSYVRATTSSTITMMVCGNINFMSSNVIGKATFLGMHLIWGIFKVYLCLQCLKFFFSRIVEVFADFP